MPYAPADSAHSQNPQRQFIELPPAQRVAEALKFLGIRRALAKRGVGSDELENIAKNKIPHGDRVGIGRIDDLNTALATGRHVDVFQSNPAAPDDF